MYMHPLNSSDTYRKRLNCHISVCLSTKHQNLVIQMLFYNQIYPNMQPAFFHKLSYFSLFIYKTSEFSDRNAIRSH